MDTKTPEEMQAEEKVAKSLDIEPELKDDEDDELTEIEHQQQQQLEAKASMLRVRGKPKYEAIGSDNIGRIRLLAGRYATGCRVTLNQRAGSAVPIDVCEPSSSGGCSGSTTSLRGSSAKLVSPRRICNSILNSIPNSATKVKFQFLVLGGAQVGKTSMLRRMHNHRCQIGEEYERTVGPDLHRLQCGQIEGLDVGGQERFMRIAQTYCGMVNNFVIVFDITNAESFLVARYWLDYLEQRRVQQREEWTEEGYEDTDPRFAVLLVGNKKDLAAQRRVSSSWAKMMAKTYDADYVELSAKCDVFLDPFLAQLETKCMNM